MDVYVSRSLLLSSVFSLSLSISLLCASLCVCMCVCSYARFVRFVTPTHIRTHSRTRTFLLFFGFFPPFVPSPFFSLFPLFFLGGCKAKKKHEQRRKQN